MPYTVSQLKSDSRFEGLPDAALEIFVAAYNAAYDQYNGDEAKAAATAWSAVGKKYKKGADGNWHEFSAEADDDLGQAQVFLKSLSDLRAVGFTEHEAQLRALREAGVDFSVEREAKLFEAGDYPDKGISVSEDELDAIIAAHQDKPPLQLKVEHTDTVFDGAIGVVKAMWRKGRELLATLSFTDPAWAFLKGLSIRGLSVALKRDKSGIAEISLVREPRVADARVFAEGTVGFSAALNWHESAVETKHTEEVKIPMPEIENIDKKPDLTEAEALNIIRQFAPNSPEVASLAQAAKDMVAFREDTLAELNRVAKVTQAATAELRTANCERIIGDYKRAGKITPAAEPFARAILDMKPLSSATVVPEETIRFKLMKDGAEIEQTAHYADVFLAFLEALPPVVNFREIAAAEAEATVLSPESRAMFEKFGVDPESDTAKKVLAELRR